MRLFEGLDLRHLRALDALLEERHVSRAAERIALTQPAVSNSLARLREHFGDELLVRSGARLVLTPFAESIRQAVRNILLDVHTLTSARPTFDPAAAERTFGMMVPDHLASMILPAIIRTLAEAAARARVRCDTPGVMREAFEQGEVDLAFLPESLLLDHHPYEHVGDEPWVFVARSGHPQALALREEHELAALPRVEAAPPRWSDPGITPAAVVAVPLVLPVVAGTDLVAVVPRSVAMFNPSSSSISILPVKPSKPAARWHMQWHYRLDADPGSRWFRSHARAATAGALRQAV